MKNEVENRMGRVSTFWQTLKAKIRAMLVFSHSRSPVGRQYDCVFYAYYMGDSLGDITTGKYGRFD